MKVKPFPPQQLQLLHYCLIFDHLIMLIKHPCQYGSWQELVEDHAEIPYQFALGIPVEHKFDVFPYLFEPTGQFSFSQLVPIPNTITDWDKQYYPTNWFLEHWGSLNDADEVQVAQEFDRASEANLDLSSLFSLAEKSKKLIIAEQDIPQNVKTQRPFFSGFQGTYLINDFLNIKLEQQLKEVKKYEDSSEIIKVKLRDFSQPYVTQ